jgi:hypothetical protein
MENNIMERYVEFICNEIPQQLNILLYIPNSIKNEVYIPKIGPKCWEIVNIEILEKYTRSAKFRLQFDKYEVEDIFFMSRHKGPDKLLDEIYNKIEKVINKTLIEDGREEEIIERYKLQKAKIKKIFNNIKLPNENIN